MSKLRFNFRFRSKSRPCLARHSSLILSLSLSHAFSKLRARSIAASIGMTRKMPRIFQRGTPPLNSLHAGSSVRSLICFSVRSLARSLARLFGPSNDRMNRSAKLILIQSIRRPQAQADLLATSLSARILHSWNACFRRPWSLLSVISPIHSSLGSLVLKTIRRTFARFDPI